MKLILKDSRRYIIRFDRDEELFEALKSFVEAENVIAAFFSGIGAAERITISYYDIDKKEYTDKEFNERLEIASINGNIATVDGKTVIHSHGVFSGRDMRAFGGHVKKLTVSATCEIFMITFEGRMERAPNNDIGLNLLT